jgi:hypothetical protein
VVIRREEREHGLPPGRDRLACPYDLDARWAEKHGNGWTGYKDHLTETISDPAGDDPAAGRPTAGNLVTDVQTTHAAVPGAAMTEPVHDSLDAAALLPGEHAVDSGYMSADLLVSSRQRGLTLLGPLLADTSAQARSGGCTADMFTIDWDSRQATCPQGTASSKWAPLRQKDGKEAISVRFPAACRACPARDKCTTAKWSGRQLFLRPREIHEAVAARAGQDTRQRKDRCNARAGVEGLMNQASHVTGIRRARYLGLDKTRLEHLAAATATAINVIRLHAWYTGSPIDRTRTTHLQRIDLAPAA